MAVTVLTCALAVWALLFLVYVESREDPPG